MAAPGGGKALPAEEHLERLKEVVAKHRDDLRKLEQAICAGTSGGGFLDEGGSDVWDPYSDAVAISLQPSEDCSVADLLVSDNKELSKIVQALTSVADNCAFLAQQARDEFFAPLSAFGEQFDDDRMEEGAEVQRITALLPFLERLAIFGTQCHAVVANGMAQLAGLYTDEPGSRYRETFKGAHPHFLLLQLADLLAALVTLDLLIETNEELRAQWGEYKRMLEGAALEPEVFGMNPNRIAKILMAVTRMEADVLDGALLRGCWMQDIAWHHAKGVSEARSNKTLSDEVLAWVKGHLAYLTSHIGDATESTHRHQVVGCLAVWVLVAQMKRGMEIDVKAIHKAVIGIKAKVPAVVLHGRALFVISDFLNKNLPSLLGKPTKEEPLSKVVAPLADKFPSQIQALELQLSAWMVRMESDFSSKVAIGEMLSTRANLLVQGVLLANQVGHLLRLLLAMHLHTQVPIRKSSLPLLLQAVRMLKAIQHTYFRKSPLIAAQVLHIQRYLQQRILQVMEPVAEDLSNQIATARTGGWKQDRAKQDMGALAVLLTDSLRGACTPLRRAASHTAWDLLPKKQVRDADVEEVRLQLRKLQFLGALDREVAEACDTSFLLFFRGLLPLFLSHLTSRWQDADELHLLMAAVNDTRPGLIAADRALLPASSQYTAPTGGPGSMLDGMRRFVEDAIDVEVVAPLCQLIETDLRLHIHSVQMAHLQQPNQLKDAAPDLAAVLRLRPLHVLGTVIDIKARVAVYLDTTFYNLTTVATHDWKTYAEMRSVAEDKFGLRLTESYLPTGTLDQGLDVLEIMRNIHVFVARYNYQMNTQAFVEKLSDSSSRYINSIGIHQVAASIRTHGMGIINTTVNYTYQFLARKLAVLSQFLFDDHIKSRLIKDAKFVRDHGKEPGFKFPYSRAVAFNTEIRRLGVDDNQHSYLDKFRQVVTEMGNALGYVRLMRAGALNFVSAAIDLVPDLAGGHVRPEGEVGVFGKAVENEGLAQETREAAGNLDGAIRDVADKFADGTDFFRLLLQVFGDQLTHESQAHLKNFYLIVPPLVVNFVSHMVTSKERLLKSSKRQAQGAFCDDGFALGLAFLLRVLDQRERMDALHWFDAVGAFLREEAQEVEKLRTDKRSRSTDQDVQALQMAITRLRTLQVENDLVLFALKGASVFFK